MIGETTGRFVPTLPLQPSHWLVLNRPPVAGFDSTGDNRGTPAHAQSPPGVPSEPEKTTDQSSHDAVGLSAHGRNPLGPFPGRSEGTDCDEGGPEEDRLLLLSGSESDLWGFVTENNKSYVEFKNINNLKILLVFMEK